MRVQFKALSAAFAVVLALSGCSTPMPIVDRAVPSGTLPFGEIDTFDKVAAKFKDYYVLYLNEAGSKRILAQTASEVSFYSAIWGVLGGIAKDVQAAAGGALLGAGAGLYGDRYRLQFQAANYELAASAMLCMYRASLGISDAELKALNINNQPASIVIREMATDGFLAVRGKLYNLQANFALGQPDPNKLKSAITAAPESTPATNGIRSLTTQDNAVIGLLPEYKKNIDKCVSMISG